MRNEAPVPLAELSIDSREHHAYLMPGCDGSLCMMEFRRRWRLAISSWTSLRKNTPMLTRFVSGRASELWIDQPATSRGERALVTRSLGDMVERRNYVQWEKTCDRLAIGSENSRWKGQALVGHAFSSVFLNGVAVNPGGSTESLYSAVLRC